MIDMKRFNLFKDNLAKHSDIKVQYKDCSSFMKVVGVCLFFNKLFMKLFVTTVANTIYFPSEKFLEHNAKVCMYVLAHEFMHIQDSERIRFYKIRYLFPQILGLLSLFSFFAFFHIAFLWCLLFLIFLLPLPSLGRKNIELRGFEMTLYIYYLSFKESNVADEQIKKALNNIAKLCNKHFIGPSYYFMWPFGVEKQLLNFVDEIMTSDVSKKNYTYKIVTKAFEDSKDQI